MLAAGIVVFLMYLPTIVPDLTWLADSGDGGELISAAMTLGIPHPPGYPTYVLVGRLFAFLPFEPVAYRFHLFSAVCTAVSAAFVTATAQRFIPQPASRGQLLLAAVPAFLFAFTPLVWQQGIVAEVYALNLAVVAAFLWALFGKRPFILTGFLFGLSLTTHLTSLLLLPLLIVYTPPRQGWKAAAGIFLGLTPFLLLPFLARQGSPVIWGDATTISGWWWLVTAQIYQPNQFGLPWSDFGSKLAAWLQIFMFQWAVWGWLLLLLSGWLVKNSPFSQKKRWGMLLGTAVLYISYGFFYNTPDAIVLTLPAWLLLSLCLWPALESVGNWSFLLPVSAVLLHLSSINGANIHNIRLPAEQIFEQSPANAIVLTKGDPDIFTLWYFHFVEGQRPDIILVDDQLFAFDWYRNNLAQHYPNLRALEEDNLSLFQTENGRRYPICHAYFQQNRSLSAHIDCSKEVTE